MAAPIPTIEDLQQLKTELIEEFKRILTERLAPPPTSKWLKSHQVMRILTVSTGTLQQMRINGTLPFTKIGGVYYYDPKDIENMLQNGKQNVKKADLKHTVKTLRK